jgi:hypothetical protein
MDSSEEGKEEFEKIRRNIIDCDGDYAKYTSLFQSLKISILFLLLLSSIEREYIAIPINSKELSIIPIPSDAQIHSDLCRETFLLNGSELSGSKGY